MQVYVPTVSIMFRYEGQNVFWTEGRTTIAEGHPILKGREHLVTPQRLDYPIAPPSEQRETRVTLEPATETAAAADVDVADEPPAPKQQPASKQQPAAKRATSKK